MKHNINIGPGHQETHAKNMTFVFDKEKVKDRADSDVQSAYKVCMPSMRATYLSLPVPLTAFGLRAFALLCDGGTDDEGDKDFMILVRVFDEGASCNLTKFLALPTCDIGTSKNMFCDHRGMF
ncbi:hypothetical protein LSAT2_001221, partial [Lamellibrachia satsuma]